MCWWCGDVSWTACSWWWVVPFVGIALCITMCMLSASQRGHRRFACWRGDRLADLDEMKKEIVTLKADMEKMKNQKGG